MILKPSFWSNDQTCARYLAICSDPHLILVLRTPNNKHEVRSLLNIPTELEESENSYGKSLLNSFLVTEVVIDLMTCKLKLSKLTTPTCICDNVNRNNFFELISPSGNILITLEEATTGQLDTKILFNKTAEWEASISQALFSAHQPTNPTHGWKHFLVTGTLFSYVLKNQGVPLESIISSTRNLDLVNQKDEDGLTALHYACINRNFIAVAVLISSGADCRIVTENTDCKSPCHICAELLDEKSLSILLSTTTRTRPDPNALDALGRTPMYVAAVEGKNVHGSYDHNLLNHCLNLFEEWGGQMIIQDDDSIASFLPHPVHVLATQRRAPDLSVILSFCNYRFDFEDSECNNESSISSRFDYPIHACLLNLRDELTHLMESGGAVSENIEISIVS